VVQPSGYIIICLQNAFKLDAPVHFLLVLEVPMTADVPLLGQVLAPVLQKGFSRIMLFVRIHHLGLFYFVFGAIPT